MASQLGKRYLCKVCKTAILGLKGGEGVVTCCGQEVELQKTEPMPSSD